MNSPLKKEHRRMLFPIMSGESVFSFREDDVLSALKGLKEELNIIAPFPMLPNEKKMLDRCNYIIDKWFPILNEAELHEHEDKSSLLLSQPSERMDDKKVTVPKQVSSGKRVGDAGELSSGVPTAQDVKHAPGNGKKGVRE